MNLLRREGRVWVVIVLLVTASPSMYALDEIVSEIDELHELDEHDRVLQLIDSELPGTRADRERAELYWRKARAILSDTDIRHRNGELSDREARTRLEDAEEAGRRAIELDDSNAEAHFWTGSAIGLEGQIRGVLRALFQAGTVRDFAEAAIERNPNHKEAHYLLGVLYRELPGGIISFGDDDRAVEYGRRAIDLHEREYSAGGVPFRYFDFYLDLAESLLERGDSGDSDEADRLIRFVQSELRRLDRLNVRQQLAEERAQELAEEL